MKLSLWIIQDLLQEFDITILDGSEYCSEMNIADSLAIKKIRLYDGTVREPDTLYLEQLEQQVHGLFSDAHIYFSDASLIHVFNRLLDLQHQLSSWYTRMKAIGDTRSNMNQLLDIANEQLDQPIAVLDTSDGIIAVTPKYAAQPVDPLWTTMIQEKSSPYNVIVKFHDPSNKLFNQDEVNQFYTPPDTIGPKGTCSQNLFYGRTWMGICFTLEIHDLMTPGMKQLFRLITDCVQYCIQQNESISYYEQNYQYFFEAMQQPSSLFPALFRSMEIHHWEEDDVLDLLIAKTNRWNSQTQIMLCRTFSQDNKHLFIGASNEEIIILVNRRLIDFDAFLDYSEPWFAKYDYQCGLSFSFRSLLSLKSAYTQCHIALNFRNHKPDIFLKIQNYIYPWALHLLCEHTDSFPLSPELSDLISYDKQHGTDLYPILITYLRCERSHTETAAALSIHRNTLFRRLEKIQTLFQLPVSDPLFRKTLLLQYDVENYRRNRFF